MDIREKLKSQILKNKDIRLDIFLNEVLYNKNGYYYKNKPLGKKNDFITAPEISQMFGEIIGLYLFYFWKTKVNSKFNLIELGPGTGTLFKDIYNAVAKYPEFIKYANIKFIEINSELTKAQKKIVKKNSSIKINWLKKIDFRSKGPSIIYSNEFFDCFPVRQFIFKEEWYEKYISYNKSNDNFFFKEKTVYNQKLLSILNKYKKEKLLEISFERNKYFENICKFIHKNGGLFFTIDYGYKKNINNFSLQAVQNHKYSSIFENIGEIDISSHVNFLDFINIAKNYKLKIYEFCSQREFLIKYGILERKKILSNNYKSEDIEIELDRLINKKKMGNLFKCLAISNL